MTLNRMLAGATSLVLAIGLLAGSAVAAGKPAPTGKVNINSATVDQLSTLPGVGAKLAARIVEYRTKSGGFKSAQELMNVRGIGEKNFAKLQPFLTTGGDTAAPAKGASR